MEIDWMSFRSPYLLAPLLLLGLAGCTVVRITSARASMFPVRIVELRRTRRTSPMLSHNRDKPTDCAVAG